MKTFNKPKPITELKPKIKSHWKLWLIFGIFMMTLIAMAGYGVKSFFDKYYFISPIQSKKVNVSPTPKPKKQAIKVEITEPVYAEVKEPIIWESEVKQTVMKHFDISEQEALDELIQRESSWNPQAINASSGACGLGQALPCEKMGCSLVDVDCQGKWIKTYIVNRYGDANQALAFHNSHGWY